MVPNADEATRRDYAIASPEMVQFVTSFGVEYTDDFPVHQPIAMSINV